MLLRATRAHFRPLNGYKPRTLFALGFALGAQCPHCLGGGWLRSDGPLSCALSLGAGGLPSEAAVPAGKNAVHCLVNGKNSRPSSRTWLSMP